MGMPCYSFSCQPSYLTAMARQGFDFSSCINEGISYLSRAQESTAKVRIGNPIPISHMMQSSSMPLTVADSIFKGRTKSRLKHWKDALCNSRSDTDEALLRSLRKLIAGSEQYCSRPCITIDICSERQARLVAEVAEEFSDDLVPLIIPSKGGEIQAVRVVLTSSKEDKDQLEKEIQNLENEHNQKLRGFREVIDFISASQKPVVSNNIIHDFAFIHSKFIAPLPSSLNEFVCSLRSVFPFIFDVNYQIVERGSLEMRGHLFAPEVLLKNQFIFPIDMENQNQALSNESKIHGKNAVSICYYFAKLCSVFGETSSATQLASKDVPPDLDGYANLFNTFHRILKEPCYGNVRISRKNPKEVSSENLIFLYGFGDGLTSHMLRNILQGGHNIFSEEFDVRLVDKSCAIVVFWKSGLSQAFLDETNSDKIWGSLKDMFSEGLRAVGYRTYKRACEMGLWEPDLADSLQKAIEDGDCSDKTDSDSKASDIYWCNDDLMINLDDL